MGLLKLVNDVREHLEGEGVSAAVTFGCREPAKQINQGPGRANRVVFAPGDDAGGLGEYGAARNPGRNPRPLRGWNLLCRVYVWAVDTTEPQNEEAQFGAMFDLHDAVVRAIYAKAVGGFEISKPRRVGKSTEIRFGEEMVFDLTMTLVPILDHTKPKSGALEAEGPTLAELPSGATEQGC